MGRALALTLTWPLIWPLVAGACYQQRALGGEAVGARAYADWEARVGAAAGRRGGVEQETEDRGRPVSVAEAADRAVVRSARVAALGLRARAARVQAEAAWRWDDPELRVGLYELPRWVAGRRYDSPALAEASGREVGPADVRVDLRVPLPNPWERAARAAGAGARAAELEARARAAEARVRDAVERALVARWEAAGEVAALRQAVAAYEAIAARGREAVTAGTETALEAATAALPGAALARRLARAQARWRAADAELTALVGAPVAYSPGDADVAAAALEELLGATARRGQRGDGDEVQRDEVGLHALVRAALARRPEVAAASARVEAARAEAYGVRGAAWPWFGFVQGRVVASTRWPTPPGEVPSALADAGVSVSLRVPLFRWVGLDGGEGAAARARERAAEARQREAVDAVVQEVRRASAGLREARRAGDVVAESVAPACEAAARALAAAQAQGRAPLRRALEVARCRLDVRLAHVRARAAELQALVALRQALGRTLGRAPGRTLGRVGTRPGAAAPAR